MRKANLAYLGKALIQIATQSFASLKAEVGVGLHAVCDWLQIVPLLNAFSPAINVSMYGAHGVSCTPSESSEVWVREGL